MPLFHDEVRRWRQDREMGRKAAFGTKNKLAGQIYSSIKCVRSWKMKSTKKGAHYGGIFNFDFAPDGALMVAACERKGILMFDPFNARLLEERPDAHNDCVNCVRFLDSRTFVTCSDDTTVCLWDARFLKHKVRTLKGHSNWVKNIEYASDVGLLLTSGFDGSIYTWDINRYSENDSDFTRVFHTNRLMRSRLSPDGSKLIIATAEGYLMIIHNLDLYTLATDLQGFKPNMYRLMQLSQLPIRQGYMYNQVFTRKKNRVEFISDFPESVHVEMITSLEVHPYGWCALSRSAASDNTSEWTCVHDIQGVPTAERQENFNIVPMRATRNLGPPDPTTTQRPSSLVVQLRNQMGLASWNDFGVRMQSLANQRPRIVVSIRIDDPSGIQRVRNIIENAVDNSDNENDENFEDPVRRLPLGNGRTDSDNGRNNDNSDNSDSSTDTDSDAENHEDVSPLSGSRETEPNNTASTSSVIQSSPALSIANQLLDHVLSTAQSSSSQSTSSQPLRPRNPYHDTRPPDPDQSSTQTPITSIKIHKDVPRLTHYIEEPAVGRGFIKEVSFSHDGRLVCSPFGYGMRLLAFDSHCRELCDCVPDSPVELYEVGSCSSHTSEVVSCKFSPNNCMVVTGCLNGQVDFHQPVL